MVFETLNLTKEEQLEVYKAVIELVKNRILKAKSK
jgi:dihydrodipicolinate synthase/N-acetylneuraminate lyase